VTREVPWPFGVTVFGSLSECSRGRVTIVGLTQPTVMGNGAVWRSSGRGFSTKSMAAPQAKYISEEQQDNKGLSEPTSPRATSTSTTSRYVTTVGDRRRPRLLAGCLGTPTGSPKKRRRTGERAGTRSSGGRTFSAWETRRVLLVVPDETIQAALLERLPESRALASRPGNLKTNLQQGHIG